MTPLIGDQAPVDGVRQPALEAPQCFLGRLALGQLAPVVDLPGLGRRTCTIAIMYRAWLSLRSPARDSRGG